MASRTRSAGGLIVAHNVNRPAPDPKFIEAITTDPRLETLFLNMFHGTIPTPEQRRMLDAVPEADVIITNPEHFSVALKYDNGASAAPVVVAKGVDHVAVAT